MKKAKYKELADFLGVSINSVKAYNKKKLLLMLLGLKLLQDKKLDNLYK